MCQSASLFDFCSVSDDGGNADQKKERTIKACYVKKIYIYQMKAKM